MLTHKSEMHFSLKQGQIHWCTIELVLTLSIIALCVYMFFFLHLRNFILNKFRKKIKTLNLSGRNNNLLLLLKTDNKI